MFLSMFLSLVYARKFKGLKYVVFMIIIIALVSLLSAVPLSFPFYVLIDELVTWFPLYRIYFFSIEITHGFLPPPNYEYYILSRFFLPLDVGVLSFFFLVNLIGAIIGYWIGLQAWMNHREMSLGFRERMRYEIPKGIVKVKPGQDLYKVTLEAYMSTVGGGRQRFACMHPKFNNECISNPYL